MLKTLRISNYAIINEADIQFSPMLNIITGETGAGKSILLGALGLLTGERADTKILFSKEKKCIVEGIFDITNYDLHDFFNSGNIDYADETIIRRELAVNGKSRAFINDTPVNLNILQQLADQLITIHSQHETLALGNSAFQLTVIDSLAGIRDIVLQYREQFIEWKNIVRQLKELRETAAKALLEKDFIEFQFTELDAAQLDNIKQDEWERELEQLNHAEEIKRNISSSVDLLENTQGNIHDSLRSVIGQLQSVSKYNTDLAGYIKRLEVAVIEIKDITRDLQTKAELVIADPQRAEDINQKLSILFRLQKKYHCRTAEELIAVRNNLNDKLFGFTSSEAEIEKLEKHEKDIYNLLKTLAKNISEKRRSVFPVLEKEVKHLLAEAGMQDAEFLVDHDYNIEKYLNDTGADNIAFLFSANKGSVPQDIKKVASGGELSRLMLCIKSLLAGSIALPTLIFDEIDTGVSGEIANKVGNILRKLSLQHQVIAITHLPQIAGKGGHHLFVYKTSDEKYTQTHIKRLTGEARLYEIAKMLSGENPSKAAIKNASELLDPELKAG